MKKSALVAMASLVTSLSCVRAGILRSPPNEFSGQGISEPIRTPEVCNSILRPGSVMQIPGGKLSISDTGWRINFQIDYYEMLDNWIGRIAAQETRRYSQDFDSINETLPADLLSHFNRENNRERLRRNGSHREYIVTLPEISQTPNLCECGIVDDRETRTVELNLEVSGFKFDETSRRTRTTYRVCVASYDYSLDTESNQYPTIFSEVEIPPEVLERIRRTIHGFDYSIGTIPIFFYHGVLNIAGEFLASNEFRSNVQISSEVFTEPFTPNQLEISLRHELAHAVFGSYFGSQTVANAELIREWNSRYRELSLSYGPRNQIDTLFSFFTEMNYISSFSTNNVFSLPRLGHPETNPNELFASTFNILYDPSNFLARYTTMIFDLGTRYYFEHNYSVSIVDRTVQTFLEMIDYIARQQHSSPELIFPSYNLLRTYFPIIQPNIT